MSHTSWIALTSLVLVAALRVHAAGPSTPAIDASLRTDGRVVAGQEPRRDCASLVGLEVAGARVGEAVPAPAPASGPIKVAHCKVSGVIEKEINFTALLPERWNERLFAGGGGGFVGAVDNQAQTSVNFGYATVGTDTGHQALPFEAGWALGNAERVVNYGHRAIHRMTEVAKAILKVYYGQDPRYSYFFGCSNGGRQALMEAQRYPADFDGIVSCAPALDFTNIAASFVRNTQVTYPNPSALGTSAISPDNLKLLGLSVLEACDAVDGVRDGVLDDPRDCKFRIAELPTCAGDQPAAACVTKAQRAAIERIYTPTTVKGAVIYPGQPFGGEAEAEGWQAWITGPNSQVSFITKGQKPSLHLAFSTEFFKYLVFGRPEWDYSTYDLSTWLQDTGPVAAQLNAEQADLTAFTNRKGKLMLAHGWADPALNPLSTIAYYQRLLAHDPRIGDSVRLFMMPGVLHCFGGVGPDTVDWFTAITDWVERGRAPERVIARKLDKAGGVENARPLCPYPQRAIYDGKGSATDPASYACRAPQAAVQTR